MARFTNEEKTQIVEHARRLYIKGFDTGTIADILKVAKTTIDKWIRSYDFDKSKRSQIIALSEIRNSILESYVDKLEGKEPKIKPDEAAKYASAFEKFSSKKQVLMYMYEAFEILSEEYQRDIQKCKSKTEKEQALKDFKKLRQKMDTVIINLNKEALGDD